MRKQALRWRLPIGLSQQTTIVERVVSEAARLLGAAASVMVGDPVPLH